MNVLTVGTFDLTHYGHYLFLNQCRQFGRPIVGINTDEFVSRYKKNYPILSYQQREKTIRSWGYVTIPNNQQESIKPLIDKTKPGLIAIGTDWLKKDYLKQIGVSAQYLEGNNIGLLYLPYTKGISSTQIKQQCQLRLQ